MTEAHYPRLRSVVAFSPLELSGDVVVHVAPTFIWGERFWDGFLPRYEQYVCHYCGRPLIGDDLLRSMLLRDQTTRKTTEVCADCYHRALDDFIKEA